jgi:hypothetical protein
MCLQEAVAKLLADELRIKIGYHGLYKLKGGCAEFLKMSGENLPEPTISVRMASRAANGFNAIRFTLPKAWRTADRLKYKSTGNNYRSSKGFPLEVFELSKLIGSQTWNEARVRRGPQPWIYMKDGGGRRYAGEILYEAHLGRDCGAATPETVLQTFSLACRAIQR